MAKKKSAKYTVTLNGKKWADIGRFELIFAVSRCKTVAAAAMEGCEDSRGTIVAAGSQCRVPTLKDMVRVLLLYCSYKVGMCNDVVVGGDGRTGKGKKRLCLVLMLCHVCRW